MGKIPKAPPHLGTHGARLWRDVHRDWLLDTGDVLAILENACIACDQLHAAREVLAREGLTIPTRGGAKAHPVAAVARSANAAMLRALSQLKLTDAPKPKVGRPSISH
jgi:P27 family predicted phage terminase small subunit